MGNRKQLAKKTVPNLKTVLSFPPEYEDLFSKEGICQFFFPFGPISSIWQPKQKDNAIWGMNG